MRGLESNPDVTILGSSPTTPCQIFRYRQQAYAIQFHIEVRTDTVREWGKVPEYRAALESSLGVNALESFDQAARASMPEMNRLSARLYENFKRLLLDAD